MPVLLQQRGFGGNRSYFWHCSPGPQHSSSVVVADVSSLMWLCIQEEVRGQCCVQLKTIHRRCQEHFRFLGNKTTKQIKTIWELMFAVCNYFYKSETLSSPTIPPSQTKNETFKLFQMSFGGFEMGNVCIFVPENIYCYLFS